VIQKLQTAGTGPIRGVLGEPNSLFAFILEGVNVRGTLLRGSRMLAEMQANHGLGPLETLVLGHAYLAAGLVTSGLKGADRLNLRVECSGPLQGFSVDSNAAGDVRGYLLKNPIELETRDFNEPSLASLWGEGHLVLSRYPEGSTMPFTGQILLEKGSLAINLARYFLKSEQTPTAFALSINFDREGNLLGAGGLFLQALPGADEKTVEELEERLAGLPSLGEAISSGESSEHYIESTLGMFFPKFLESRRVEFFCPCSAERFAGFIGALPLKDLEDLAENGPFPLRTTCHNCNSGYEFEKDKIQALLAKREAD
jgi:molecular chaperone Hsp33